MTTGTVTLASANSSKVAVVQPVASQRRMPRRTRPKDVEQTLHADEVDAIVKDKRASWRADAARARRRNRRYQRQITEHLLHTTDGNEE